MQNLNYLKMNKRYQANFFYPFHYWLRHFPISKTKPAKQKEILIPQCEKIHHISLCSPVFNRDINPIKRQISTIVIKICINKKLIVDIIFA